MQIVPGNAFSQTVSGSAPAGGAHRPAATVRPTVSSPQAPQTAGPRSDAGGQPANASASRIERPIPAEQRANLPPGSIIDIRV